MTVAHVSALHLHDAVLWAIVAGTLAFVAVALAVAIRRDRREADDELGPP